MAGSSDGFAEKVREVLKDPQSLPQEFKDWLIQHNAVNPPAVETVRAPAFLSTGLQGSNTSSRFVGATASGHPTTGYYLIGDYCVDQTGGFWICTVSGSPGTWLKVGTGGTPPGFFGARIRASSTQSIPDSTDTDLVYQTIDFDTNGMVDLVSNDRIITFQTPGIYLCICETGWAYSSAGRRLNGIVFNNYVSTAGVYSASDSRMATWAPVGGTVRTGNTSICLLSASKGDFISSGCLQASGGSLNCNGGTTGSGGADAYLSAALWGAT